MSKKKSLGSSPIGYSSLGSNSYQFIRDLGVSSNTETAEKEEEIEADTETTAAPRSSNGNAYSNQGSNRNSDSGKKQSEKKIVSYYLEKELIARLKTLADDQNSYYSSVVSAAIEFWVKKHGY